MSVIFHDVPLIPQNTSNTCWYACCRMIVEYHRQKRQQSTIAGGEVGQANVTATVEGNNTRLAWENFDALARQANLRTTYLSPTPEGLVSLLVQKGPLIYSGITNGYRGYTGAGHSVVIKGCAANAASATVHILDPWEIGIGARISESFNDFFNNIQAEAPFIHI